MQLQPVTGSSNIKAVGFENGTLHVEFQNGATYEYRNVSEELYQRFLAAPSLGKFLNQHIRPLSGRKL